MMESCCWGSFFLSWSPPPLTSPIPASPSCRSVPCQLGGVRSLHLVLFGQRWTSAAWEAWRAAEEWGQYANSCVATRHCSGCGAQRFNMSRKSSASLCVNTAIVRVVSFCLVERLRVVGRCSWTWVLDNVPTNRRVTFDSWGDVHECGVWTALTHSSTSWKKCVGE